VYEQGIPKVITIGTRKTVTGANKVSGEEAWVSLEFLG
jgi:hypothetical protein